MLLRDLLGDLDVVDVRGDVHRTITRVSRDSRDCDEQTLFVAVRGGKVDGHDLIAGVRAGAVVVEREVATDLPVVRVADTKRALALAAASLAGHPGRAMRVIGVTGTKGKTTTTTLIEGALSHAGRVAGFIGTTGSRVGGVDIPSELTTPEAPQMQALFARMRDAGATDVAIEVSSIGLVQRRVDGIPFHAAVFTNLGHDHLDFHGTLDAYADAKARLFRDLLRPAGGMPRAILSADDPASERMDAPADRWTFGFSPSDLRIGALRMDAAGMRFRLDTPLGSREATSPLVGRHNALNLAAAAGACLVSGLDLDATIEGLASVKGVPGRLEAVPNARGLLVVVDYAHTEESLAAVLEALREVTTGRLWCVFGCGGDRDATKRPRMGAVAAHLADAVVVTSDNPRSESPRAIVDAILSGMDAAPAHVDVDRAAAIRWALAAAAPGDVVLIAGKGHETYQEIAGIKHPFDDREIAREALR